MTNHPMMIPGITLSPPGSPRKSSVPSARHMSTETTPFLIKKLRSANVTFSPLFFKFNLKIMQFNIRHYKSNRHFLTQLLQDHNPDIVLLNSTCTNNNIKIKHFGYNSHQTDGDAYDGVAILSRSSLNFELLSHWVSPHFAAIKFQTASGSIIVATTYCRPNTNIPYTDLNNLFNNRTPTLILADFNAKHHTFQHHTSNQHGSLLFNLYRHKKLSFLGPDFPTVYTENGSGRPDLVFANQQFNQFHYHIQPGPLSGSDHIPVLMSISTNPIIIPSTPRFNYNRANWEGFTNTLSNTHIDNTYEGKHNSFIDNQLDFLHTSIQTAANAHIPKTSYSIKYSFTPSIRSQRLLICYNTRFEHNKHNYGYIKNDLSYLRTHIINSLTYDHEQHWKKLINSAQQNRKSKPAEFWKHINRLKGTAKPNINSLFSNGRKITEPQEIVDTFRHHWQPVYHPHPPARGGLAHTRLVDNFNRRNEERISPEPFIRLANLSQQHELTTPIDPEDVKRQFKSTPKKASGRTGINYHMVRRLPNNLIDAFTQLFNACLASGYFPSSFKTANISFIPKKGMDPQNPLNYRPISLLEVTGKCFEHIINTRLHDYLEDENLLSPKQFGFRRQRSTQDSLCILTNYIHINTKCLGRKRKVAVITKDVKKAFDTVWHEGLIYKICNHFRFPIIIQKLLSHYLTNRSISIKFKNTFSQPFTPLAGVPQGSVLAPTLYILFNNDLPNPYHANSLTLIYADDVTQAVCSSTIDGLTTRATTELDRVAKWEEMWRIKTHPQKAKIIYFGARNPNPRHIYLNSRDPTRTPIQRSHTSTVLGLTYDINLKFNTHISIKTALAKKTLFQLYRFRFASHNTKKHLYKTLIRPLLTYAPLHIALTTQTNRAKLQIVQNKALRWICNTLWHDFITNNSLHQQCNIVPINQYSHNLTAKQILKVTERHPHYIGLLEDITPQFRRHTNLFHPGAIPPPT